MLHKISLLKTEVLREVRTDHTQWRKTIFGVGNDAVDQTIFSERCELITNRVIDDNAFAQTCS